MEALLEFGSEDLDIYATRAVQMLVDTHWHGWDWINWTFILLPKLLQLLFFTIWSCILMPTKEISNSWFHSMIEVLILLISLYFFGIDASVYRQKIRSFWRDGIFTFLQIVATVLVFTCICYEWNFESKDKELDDTFWELLAWTAFFLWFSLIL